MTGTKSSPADYKASLAKWVGLLSQIDGEYLKRNFRNVEGIQHSVKSQSRYADCWALCNAIAELETNGRTLQDTLKNVRTANWALNRWALWKFARLRCFRYETVVDWPEATSRDPVTLRATYAAKLFSRHATRLHPDVETFIRECQPQFWTTFLRAVAKSRSKHVQHRELDEWLILVWPIVEHYQWSYSELGNVAGKRFPNQGGQYPLDSHDSLRKHCQEQLANFLPHDHRLAPRKRGNKAKRPAQNLALLGDPPLIRLALEIRK